MRLKVLPSIASEFIGDTLLSLLVEVIDGQYLVPVLILTLKLPVIALVSLAVSRAGVTSFRYQI